MSETYLGRCLCGAVRFEARGRPKGVFWCHCNSCRRHSGAPVSVFVGFENNAVTVTDHYCDVQIIAGNHAWLLSPLRLDADLRYRAFSDRDALSRRRLRPGGGAATGQAFLRQ
jgi:hypothetical protein